MNSPIKIIIVICSTICFIMGLSLVIMIAQTGAEANQEYFQFFVITVCMVILLSAGAKD